MELRSSHRKDNYKELQTTLRSMGFYEDGIELQEMRDVLDALQMSASESETYFFDHDMELALRESELDFMPNQDGRVLNSTMMSVHHNISPSCSPDISSEKIIVEAEVHHAMDWSPPNKSLQRKRVATRNMVVDNRNNPAELDHIDELLEPDDNRFHMCAPTAAISNHDTETKIANERFSNSSRNSSHFENSFQASTSSSHQICIPVSEHRIHDSGLITSYEAPHSSCINTSSSITRHSTASLNSLENFVHEVRGPVSLRRIHDSGVNISVENPHALNPNYSFENSSYFESSRLTSTSSAIYQYNIDDDSDSST